MINWRHLIKGVRPVDKKFFKSQILLITYAVVLVAFIVKLDAVGGWLSSVISAFKPLLIGFAVAFVLNRPCNYFAGLYGKKLPEKAAKAARPLAVVTCYLIVVLLLAGVVALVVPELVKSIQTFAGNLSTYAGNFQALYDSIVEKLTFSRWPT